MLQWELDLRGGPLRTGITSGLKVRFFVGVNHAKVLRKVLFVGALCWCMRATESVGRLVAGLDNL